jgi:hypothetical protein
MSNTITGCLNLLNKAVGCEPNCGDIASEKNEDCVNCICEQCDNPNLNLTPDQKACCNTISSLCAVRPIPPPQPIGCFDKCTGNVDTSSYSIDIINNCCNQPDHISCCPQNCSTGSNVHLPKSPFNIRRIVKLTSANQESPIDAFCSGVLNSASLTSLHATVGDDQSYCATSKDPLAPYACKYCKDSRNFESCALSNSENIINDLNASGASPDVINQVKSNLDLIFCRHQNDMDNCRSCMLCSYLKINPNILKSGSNSSESDILENYQNIPKNTLTAWHIVLIVGAIILVIYIMKYFFHSKHGKHKRR